MMMAGPDDFVQGVLELLRTVEVKKQKAHMDVGRIFFLLNEEVL
jgi:hypothetical protein